MSNFLYYCAKKLTMHNPINDHVRQILRSKLEELEQELNANVFTYSGPILTGSQNEILRLFEMLSQDAAKRDNLVVILTTGGGSAEAVERYVNIIRHHFNEVSFVVPDYAYSAGTIFCMSGDQILMDYFSVLGPIDPQIQNKDGKLVAALGYLDKVNELVEKSRQGQLTQAEFLILKELDLAELRSFEQAKELTITLLKKWLVKYKFKNWYVHRTDPEKKDMQVTHGEKEERAEQIADALSDNNRWKSHGRPINLVTLREELRLEIEDYSENIVRSKLIRGYYALVRDYIARHNLPIFVQTRNYV